MRVLANRIQVAGNEFPRSPSQEAIVEWREPIYRGNYVLQDFTSYRRGPVNIQPTRPGYILTPRARAILRKLNTQGASDEEFIRSPLGAANVWIPFKVVGPEVDKDRPEVPEWADEEDEVVVKGLEVLDYKKVETEAGAGDVI